MGQPQPPRLLAVAVLLAGGAVSSLLLAWSAPLSGRDYLLGLVFTALVAGLQRVQLPVADRLGVPGDLGALLLALLVGGPGAAVLAATLSAGILRIGSRRSVHRILLTASCNAVGIGAFSGVYVVLVGIDSGAVVSARILAGDWALGGRFLAATLLGAGALSLTSRFLALRCSGAATPSALRAASRVALGSLALAPALLAIASLVAATGIVTIIFLLPTAGLVWGASVLVRARRSGSNLSVALRLSAFLTAAVGSVFVILAAVVLGTFSVRYTEAVVSGQALLGQSAALTLEEVVRRGESLRVSLVPESTLERLRQQSPTLAYAGLMELRKEERRPIRITFRPDVERFRFEVGDDLETAGSGRLRWSQGARQLRVENTVIPVLGPDGRPVAELHLGIDLGAVSTEVQELGLLLGGTTLLLFSVLLLLLRRYSERGIVAPLHRVGSALERIAQDGADLGDRLPVDGDREIAELGVHFNHFADRLETIIRATRATATENARLFEQQKATADRLRTQAEELERAYGQLRKSQEQLLVAEKMAALGKLTAGIAHEINSPLGGVMNSLELARTYAEEYRASAVDPEVTPDDHRAIAADLLEALRGASTATQKVAQFVRTIKGQTRTGEERNVPFDPALEVGATLVLLQHEFKHRQVDVRTALHPDLRLLGDPGKFGLLVQNLVSNAVDAYDGAEAAIWVRLRPEGDDLVLEVEDRGCGIAEEVRPRIFDYLFTTKEVGKGTGLGLSMVHSIVTSHFGGEVQLSTEVGRGTTFQVRVPMQRAGSEHRYAAEPIRADSPGLPATDPSSPPDPEHSPPGAMPPAAPVP